MAAKTLPLRLAHRSFGLSYAMVDQCRRTSVVPSISGRWPSPYTINSPLSLPTRRLLSTTNSNDQIGQQQSRLPSDFLSSLQSQHPSLKISTNPYELDSHGHGESHHPTYISARCCHLPNYHGRNSRCIETMLQRETNR